VLTLSLVIPATNRPPTLGRVLDAVSSAAAPPEEVIVVDRPEGLGPAGARNLGAGRASGDVLVFVDADVEVHEDAFARIRAAFEQDGALTAVFGSYDDDPADGGVVSDFRNLLHHHVHHEAAGEATTFWAGLGAMRRVAFLDAGGFDERRYPYSSIEDIELGTRLTKQGARIVLDPAIQGKHLKRWTLASMTTTDLLRRGVPWLRLLLEEGSPSTALNLGWRHRVGTASAVLLVPALLRRRHRSALAIVALLLALDHRFYALLLRRRGGTQLAAGVPLHIVHRLTSAVAVPLALASHLAARGTTPPGRPDRHRRR
jgi:GT2 family glycosyltransferase